MFAMAQSYQKPISRSHVLPGEGSVGQTFLVCLSPTTDKNVCPTKLIAFLPDLAYQRRHVVHRGDGDPQIGVDVHDKPLFEPPGLLVVPVHPRGVPALAKVLHELAEIS